jgi:hypothetical protein
MYPMCALIKSRKIRWAGHAARLGERRGVYRVLVGKPEGKSPLGRPRHRLENNMKVDLQEVGVQTGLGQVMGTCECGQWRT